MTAQFCQPDDVRNVLRGLDSVGTGTAAELPDSQLIESIIDASALVSSYAGTDYEADQYNPNPVVPTLVQKLTLAIAAFYATVTYRKGKSLDAFDPVYLRYTDARKTLSDIVQGLIEVNPGKPNEAPEHQGRVRNTIPGIFTPADAGVKFDQGRIRARGNDNNAWGGYAPWLGPGGGGDR